MENRPIKDRLQDVRALSKEFGGYEGIPEDQLAALQYDRQVDEEGSVRLVPFERLSVDGLAVATQAQPTEQAERQRGCKAPFERIMITGATKAGFIGVHPTTFIRKRNRELEKIGYGPGGGVSYGGLDFLAKDSTVRLFAEQARNIKVYIGDQVNVYTFEGKLSQSYFAEKIYEIFGDFEEEDNFARAVGGAELTTTEESEEAWTHLERLKSKLADIEELEASFESEFDSLREGYAFCPYTLDQVKENASILFNSYMRSGREHKTAMQLLQADELPTTNLRAGELPSGFGFLVRLGEVIRVLSENKFQDVAERLVQCSNISEVRTTLKDSIANNNVALQYKEAERTLLASRQQMRSPVEIEAFNVQLHQMRKAKKQDLRILRGAAEYFELPRLYADAVKAHIGEVQDRLKSKTKQNGRTGFVLDGRPDAKLDANPGRKSGDCTDGMPLPFNTHIPVHNVKIFKNNTHAGNIYLLETTAPNEYPATPERPDTVWHLEAIQLPAYDIDHVDFIKELVAGLAEQAAEKGIVYITVNRRSHHMSNYDYMSDAILKYLGIDQAQAVMSEEYPENDPDVLVKQIDVDFPDHLEGYSNFQGAGDRQFVLWRNPDTSNKR